MAHDVEAAGAQAAVPKRGRGKLMIFILLPVLLLLGGAAGVYFSGLGQSLLGKKPDATAEADVKETKKETVFYDFPDLLVNLNTGGHKSSFLKMTISFALEKQDDQAKIVSVQPRITDMFQSYLRELRPEDLRGSAGLYRLREELLLRVNDAAEPVHVDDILFKEMLVQ